MDYDSIFKEKYRLLNIENKEDLIESFLDNNEKKYKEPLKAVYINKKFRSEMFLIFDCLIYNQKQIEDLLNIWEAKVLEFINFEKVLKDYIYYLKYNIFLLFLVNDNKISNEFRYKTEKSLAICRKILLSCDSDGNILDKEFALIPFHFDNIKNRRVDNLTPLENKLYKFLPEKEIVNINYKSDFGSNDAELIERWLKNVHKED